MSRTDKTSAFICDYCDKRCSSNSSVRRHIRNVHKVSTSEPKYDCDECHDKFVTVNELRSHHVHQHSFRPVYEQHHFPTLTDFKSWKENVEKETRSHFIATGGTTEYSFLQRKKVTYYGCHRSGSFAPRGIGVRRIKRRASVRCGKRCFAAMTVTETDAGVSVMFQTEHRGHDFELCHVFLSKSERAAIAAKLQEGVPMDKVLEDARLSMDDKLERINLITKQDLRNIKRDARASGTAKRWHGKDYASVQLWVEMMRCEMDNPVVFFKQQRQPDSRDVLDRRQEDLLAERDFMLVIMTPLQKKLLEVLGTDRICVDGAHEAADSNFIVMTLLWVDERGAGFPVSYCISNRVDRKAILTFFTAVKSKTGPITAEFLLSSDTSYDAWEEVMGQADCWLLCGRHMDKHWQQVINEDIQDEKLKAAIPRAIRSIMDASDEETLKVRIGDFSRWCDVQCKEKAGLLKFKECFVKQYVQHAETWTACFKRGARTKANTHHGALDKVLWHWREKTKRKVHDLISVLLRLATEKIFDLLAKLDKNVESEFKQRTLIGHACGLTIAADQVSGLTSNYELRRNLCKHIHAVFTSIASSNNSPEACADSMDPGSMSDSLELATAGNIEVAQVEELPFVGANVEIEADLLPDTLDTQRSPGEDGPCGELQDDQLGIPDRAARERPRAIRSLCYAVIVMNTCDDEHLVRHYWRQRRAYIFMRLLAILSLRFSWAGFRLAINLVPFNQTGSERF
ncbi:hypothetical protein HPB50_003045 [Hyalomma asiaticum]|uniref:Uncharacterized protein n=1 Tax=Hyalomma asiaticum TaxID=266040 RepID=A0ACB7SDI1_HYAAI|nr:hypothetical protein HPB50_003045 [Hyalomma asiaticum]